MKWKTNFIVQFIKFCFITHILCLCVIIRNSVCSSNSQRLYPVFFPLKNNFNSYIWCLGYIKKKKKDKPTHRESIFSDHLPNSRLTSRIYSEILEIKNNTHLHMENIWIDISPKKTGKHAEMYSSQFIVRKCRLNLQWDTTTHILVCFYTQVETNVRRLSKKKVEIYFIQSSQVFRHFSFGAKLKENAILKRVLWIQILGEDPEMDYCLKKCIWTFSMTPSPFRWAELERTKHPWPPPSQGFWG